MTNRLPHHPFWFDMRDDRGVAWCQTCGLPKQNAVHQLPDTVDELSDRIAGDHDNNDDEWPGGNR